MPRQTKIAVVGSLNIDYFTQVGQFPMPGETVMAEELVVRFGGKGANQAVAAARLGAQVTMIGSVGDDEMGRQYLERLGEIGIGTDGIAIAESASTGSAFITVDRAADNTIVVAPGANARLTVEQIEASARPIRDGDCLILQNEVPLQVNLAAMAIARTSNTRIFYNPAPWNEASATCGSDVDCLIVNETEAENLLGAAVDSLQQLAAFPGVVVTRGANSTLANDRGQLVEVAPPAVTPVDTVGAGDTFVAALAVSADQFPGDFSKALQLANAAAALSTQRLGAQEAMPSQQDLARFRESR